MPVSHIEIGALAHDRKINRASCRGQLAVQIAADIPRRVRRVNAGLFRREPHNPKERTNGDDMSLIADRTPRGCNKSAALRDL